MGPKHPQRSAPKLERADATVERWAPGGKAVARTEAGRTFLVHGALPGERVSLAVDGRSAAVTAVTSPSPARVVPSCPHWRDCGACDWMHQAESARAPSHQALVLGLLSHELGLPLDALPQSTYHAASATLGYRQRARLHVELGRSGLHIGYHRPGSDSTFDLQECIVLTPVLNAAYQSARELLRAHLRSIPGRNPGATTSRNGVGELELVHDVLSDKALVGLQWNRDLSPEFLRGWHENVTSGNWVGAWIELEGAGVPMLTGRTEPTVAGADGTVLRLPRRGFAQSSLEGGMQLATRVAALASECLRPTRSGKVWEYHAGSGTLSVLLAKACPDFEASEQQPEAVACLRENLLARSLKPRVRQGDSEQGTVPRGLELVVLDPPRTGAPKLCAQLALARPHNILYVACDPVSLARDLKPLVAAGYDIDAVEFFDLFPQTHHVETVVRLSRR